MHLYKCDKCGKVYQYESESIYAPFDDMPCIDCDGRMEWAGQDVHGGMKCDNHVAPAHYMKWMESDAVKDKLKKGIYEPLRKSDDLAHRLDGRTIRK